MCSAAMTEQECWRLARQLMCQIPAEQADAIRVWRFLGSMIEREHNIDAMVKRRGPAGDVDRGRYLQPLDEYSENA